MKRFSSRQIVTMVVAGCAALILTPTAVYAATATSVTIADPLHAAHKARVSSAGRLYVGDGGGSLTVNGTVKSAAPGTPWNQINDVGLTAGSTRAVLYESLGATKLHLTSFTAAIEGGSGSVRIFVIVYVSDSGSGDCQTLTGANFGAAERFVIMVPAGQTQTVTYPTPLVYSAYASAARKYCVDVESNGTAGYVAHISASGYLT